MRKLRTSIVKFICRLPAWLLAIAIFAAVSPAPSYAVDGADAKSMSYDKSAAAAAIINVRADVRANIFNRFIDDALIPFTKFIGKNYRKSVDIKPDEVSFINHGTLISIKPLIVEDTVYIPIQQLLQSLQDGNDSSSFHTLLEMEDKPLWWGETLYEDDNGVYCILSATDYYMKAGSNLIYADNGDYDAYELELNARVIMRDDVLYVPIDLFADPSFWRILVSVTDNWSIMTGFIYLNGYIDKDGNPAEYILMAEPVPFNWIYCSRPVRAKSARIISRQDSFDAKYTLTYIDTDERTVLYKDGQLTPEASHIAYYYNNIRSTSAYVQISGLKTSDARGISLIYFDMPDEKTDQFGCYLQYVVDNDLYTFESNHYNASDDNYALFEDGFESEITVKKNGVTVESGIMCRLTLNETTLNFVSLDGEYHIICEFDRILLLGDLY